MPSRKQKQQDKTLIFVAIIGVVSAAIGSLIMGYSNIQSARTQVKIPIEATQTAEAKFVAVLSANTSTPIIVVVTATPQMDALVQTAIAQTQIADPGNSNTLAAATSSNESSSASYAVGFDIDKARASRGEVVTYRLIVTNNGKTDLSNIFIYGDARPLYTSYVNGSSIVQKHGKITVVTDAWYADDFSANLGTLESGEALTFEWSVSVNENAPVGHLIENVIGVKTAELQNPTGYGVGFAVSENHSSSSLLVTTSFNRSSVAPGETCTFTINVRNNGDIDQTNVLVYNILPASLIYKLGSTRLSFRGVLELDDGWIGQVGIADGGGINLGDLNSTEEAAVIFQLTLSNNVVNNQVVENFGQVKSDQIENFIQRGASFTVVVP